MDAYEQRGEVILCRPGGTRLDSASASGIRSWLIEQVNKGRQKFVINLDPIEFIDSSGLSALVAAHRSLSGKGGIRLCGVRPEVGRVFEMTRLNKLFTSFENEEGALSDF